MVGTDMVDLYVGPENDHFRIHKAAHCSKIPYFDKMFNGGFSETSKNTAIFPEDDAKSFNLVLGWVHHSSIKVLEETNREGYAVQPLVLLSLRKIAEKLCFGDYKTKSQTWSAKSIGDAMALPNARSILMAYSKLSESCALRKYYAHLLRFCDCSREDL